VSKHVPLGRIFRNSSTINRRSPFDDENIEFNGE
jgi:hypothetical protein